ncbi:MAG TPA: thiamine phosphate synthase [Anaeromyxobacteraceae bacterium]
MKPPRVYLVTEGGLVPDLVAALRAALAGLPPGAVAVQLREKRMPARDLLALARALTAVCRQSGQPLLVNDRLDVALAAGAAGVHLPSTGFAPEEARRLLPPGTLVGVSCHSAEDVARAAAGGADFATFGPVFDTPSKRRFGAPVGLARLAEAARLGLPLLGLGGVDLANAAQVVAAGAHGVAAIRAWLGAPDPGAAVRALVAACA